MKLIMEWYREPLLGWLFLQVQYQKENIRKIYTREQLQSNDCYRVLHEVPAKVFRRPRVRLMTYRYPEFYKDWDKDETPKWRCGIHLQGAWENNDHYIISVNPRYSDWIMDAIYDYNVTTSNNEISRKDVLIWNPKLEKYYWQQHDVRKLSDQIERKICKFIFAEQSLCL